MSTPPSAKRQVRVGVYNIDEMIGSGSFAKVFRGEHRVSRQTVAVKAISRARLNKKLMENLESEISILKSLEHPNIVCLHDIQVTERHIYLILEYCSGGDLTHVLRTHGPVSEWRAQQYLAQLADGLSVLRRHNLVHRDLKPHNLLLATPELPRPPPLADGSRAPEPAVPLLKIADFGFARHISPHALAETLCGSPLYMAPEILRYEKYDAKADLWSVGAILFELLTGVTPFKGANHVELLHNIQTYEPPLPVVDSDGRVCSAPCNELLRALLRRNPLERLTFAEFFNHDFVRNAGATATAEHARAAHVAGEAAGFAQQQQPQQQADGGGSMAAVSMAAAALRLHTPPRAQPTPLGAQQLLSTDGSSAYARAHAAVLAAVPHPHADAFRQPSGGGGGGGGGADGMAARGGAATTHAAAAGGGAHACCSYAMEGRYVGMAPANAGAPIGQPPPSANGGLLIGQQLPLPPHPHQRAAPPSAGASCSAALAPALCTFAATLAQPRPPQQPPCALVESPQQLRGGGCAAAAAAGARACAASCVSSAVFQPPAQSARETHAADARGAAATGVGGGLCASAMAWQCADAAAAGGAPGAREGARGVGAPPLAPALSSSPPFGATYMHTPLQHTPLHTPPRHAQQRLRTPGSGGGGGGSGGGGGVGVGSHPVLTWGGQVACGGGGGGAPLVLRTPQQPHEALAAASPPFAAATQLLLGGGGGAAAGGLGLSAFALPPALTQQQPQPHGHATLTLYAPALACGPSGGSPGGGPVASRLHAQAGGWHAPPLSPMAAVPSHTSATGGGGVRVHAAACALPMPSPPLGPQPADSRRAFPPLLPLFPFPMPPSHAPYSHAQALACADAGASGGGGGGWRASYGLLAPPQQPQASSPFAPSGVGVEAAMLMRADGGGGRADGGGGRDGRADAQAATVCVREPQGGGSSAGASSEYVWVSLLRSTAAAAAAVASAAVGTATASGRASPPAAGGRADGGGVACARAAAVASAGGGLSAYEFGQGLGHAAVGLGAATAQPPPAEPSYGPQQPPPRARQPPPHPPHPARSASPPAGGAGARQLGSAGGGAVAVSVPASDAALAAADAAAASAARVELHARAVALVADAAMGDQSLPAALQRVCTGEQLLAGPCQPAGALALYVRALTLLQAALGQFAHADKLRAGGANGGAALGCAPDGAGHDGGGPAACGSGAGARVLFVNLLGRAETCRRLALLARPAASGAAGSGGSSGGGRGGRASDPDGFKSSGDDEDDDAADGCGSGADGERVNACALVYRQAVALGAEAAVDELLGNLAVACSRYGPALLLLDGLLAEPELAHADRLAVHKCATAFSWRLHDCAGGGGAGGEGRSSQ